ncbi:MAG: hypothetical protein IPG50_15820 [Myxococcales bacterium]|nr:hypothetical protein [Myxococcales bacterium]
MKGPTTKGRSARPEDAHRVNAKRLRAQERRAFRAALVLCVAAAAAVCALIRDPWALMLVSAPLGAGLLLATYARRALERAHRLELRVSAKDAVRSVFLPITVGGAPVIFVDAGATEPDASESLRAASGGWLSAVPKAVVLVLAVVCAGLLLSLGERGTADADPCNAIRGPLSAPRGP